MDRRRALIALLLLAGCAAPPRPAAPPLAAAPAEPSARAQWYLDEAARGGRVLQVDASRSLVSITVRRAGRLARLGHDHLVSSRQVGGFVAPAAGRADLWLRADQLEVDDPALRDPALGPQPSPDAIAGTRRNMLDHVLQAQRFPWVMLSATRAGEGRLRLDVTLNGATRAIEADAQVNDEGKTLSAKGSFTLRQSDFGIVPFSVLRGALAVQDEVAVTFSVTASEAPR